MPRRLLPPSERLVVHALNRSVRRVPLFEDNHAYQAFAILLTETLEKEPTRLLAFCLMSNHWHLVLWPIADELPRFMRLLTMNHARRWHKAHRTSGTGPVYQNRYRSHPVHDDHHLLSVIRYVERNPLRANMVQRAEDWRWSSLWQRCNSCNEVPLSDWPIPRPADWVEHVNRPQTVAEVEAIRDALRRK